MDLDLNMDFDSSDMCSLVYGGRVIQNFAQVIRGDMVKNLREQGNEGFNSVDVKNAAMTLAHGVENLGLVLSTMTPEVCDDEAVFVSHMVQVISHFLHLGSICNLALHMFPKELVDVARQIIEKNFERATSEIPPPPKIVLPGQH